MSLPGKTSNNRYRLIAAILLILQFTGVVLCCADLVYGAESRLLNFLLVSVLVITLIPCCLLAFGPFHRSSADTRADKAPDSDIPERHSVDQLSARYEETDKLSNLGCFLLKIGNLARINSEKGHEAGDRLIEDFCNILHDVGREYGNIGRNGGNEYLVIIENCDHTVSDLFLADLAHRINAHNDVNPDYPIELSYAGVLNNEAGSSRFFGLIARAYQKYEGSAQTLL